MDICGYMRVCDGEFTTCYDGWSYAIGCDVMAIVQSLKKEKKMFGCFITENIHYFVFVYYRYFPLLLIDIE